MTCAGSVRVGRAGSLCISNQEFFFIFNRMHTLRKKGRWEGGPSKIPWSFKSAETMYLLKGKVKVTVDGHGDDGSFEIGGGDLVVFPKGMDITWEVIEAVKKHYNLEKEK
ncbi:RmlC-like jelly roll fold [Senna tora]|uniref:RmlC-like jelly roll fold n=1 Tax=Senna tora TaxID=362788 RepID=A0A834WBS3_9FABA|nr:RmlC-like jelly roll fold [Senna tora]